MCFTYSWGPGRSHFTGSLKKVSERKPLMSKHTKLHETSRLDPHPKP